MTRTKTKSTCYGFSVECEMTTKPSVFGSSHNTLYIWMHTVIILFMAPLLVGRLELSKACRSAHHTHNTWTHAHTPLHALLRSRPPPPYTYTHTHTQAHTCSPPPPPHTHAHYKYLHYWWWFSGQTDMQKRSVFSPDLKVKIQTQKGSEECLFILTLTRCMHIFGEISFVKPLSDS